MHKCSTIRIRILRKMIKFIPRNSHFTRISIFRNVIALFDNEKRHQIFMSSSILESVEHLIVNFPVSRLLQPKVTTFKPSVF